MVKIDKNGLIERGLTADPTDQLTIAGDTAPGDLPDFGALNDSDIVISFGSSADGRGFSLAKIISRQLANQGTLIGSGNLLPDQLKLAWYCGFDAVLLSDEHFDRCGADAWRKLA